MLGSPIGFILIPGQASEYEQAKAMIAEFEVGFVLADKGDDTSEFIKTTQSHDRSIATCCERLARNDMAMLSLIATIIWLK